MSHLFTSQFFLRFCMTSFRCCCFCLCSRLDGFEFSPGFICFTGVSCCVSFFLLCVCMFVSLQRNVCILSVCECSESTSRSYICVFLKLFKLLMHILKSTLITANKLVRNSLWHYQIKYLLNSVILGNSLAWVCFTGIFSVFSYRGKQTCYVLPNI